MMRERELYPDDSDLVEDIIAVMAPHVGGWVGNGTKDTHCSCGHRPAFLGEFHLRHVARNLVAELNLTRAPT